MRPRAFVRRARRIIDRLDAQLERQTFAKGADAPHLVSLVSAYHRASGYIESDAGKLPFATVVLHIRVLRRLVTSHAMMVRRLA